MRATKSEHRPFELLIVHLPVTHDDARFGNEATQQVADREDRLHAVVHEVDLAAAFELVTDGTGDDLLIELHHVGLDGQPILRRRFDDRHVANADERHVQRARNRRRAHGEHVHLPAQLLDLLLVRHAEALFLVDDEQAQVAELHVLRQQPVGSDDDVQLSRGEVGERFLLLLLRAEPADHVDADREAAEALAQRLLVLEGEDGRRRENRDLLAVHHHLEGGAHGHFGLAVADVAAEQAVHRRVRLEILLDVADRRLLVDREVVGKRVLEFLLPVRIGAERVTRNRLARGVELEQLLGHVAHGFLDSCLRPFPGRAAKPVDGRPRRARVLLHEIEPFDRHEQLVFAGIAQLEELLLLVAHADLLEADEHADAVVDMHDEIAHFQVAQIGEERLGGGPFPVLAALFLENVCLGIELQRRIREAEAAREVAGGHQHCRVPGIVGPIDRDGEEVVFLQQLDRPLRPSAGGRDEEDRLAFLPQSLDVGHPVRHATMEFDTWLAADVAAGDGTSLARIVHAEFDKCCCRGQAFADVVGVDEEFGGWADVAGQRYVAPGL